MESKDSTLEWGRLGPEPLTAKETEEVIDIIFDLAMLETSEQLLSYHYDDSYAHALYPRRTEPLPSWEAIWARAELDPLILKARRVIGFNPDDNPNLDRE
jgi:hypothetical protein